MRRAVCIDSMTTHARYQKMTFEEHNYKTWVK